MMYKKSIKSVVQMWMRVNVVVSCWAGANTRKKTKTMQHWSGQAKERERAKDWQPERKQMHKHRRTIRHSTYTDRQGLQFTTKLCVQTYSTQMNSTKSHTLVLDTSQYLQFSSYNINLGRKDLLQTTYLHILHDILQLLKELQLQTQLSRNWSKVIIKDQNIQNLARILRFYWYRCIWYINIWEYRKDGTGTKMGKYHITFRIDKGKRGELISTPKKSKA